jgi:hypothetical protein
MSKSHQYEFTKEGHTYILTATTPKPPATKEQISHVHLNQCVSLCLVRPITPNNTTHPILETMNPLLQEFSKVFQPSEGLPPSRNIDHSIHLILDLIYLMPQLTVWPQHKHRKWKDN